MPTTPRVALIYPPVTDPTSGYHSLSYLDSYARAQGLPAADLIDANIEAFHHTLSPAGAARLAADLSAADPGRYADYLDPAESRAHLLRVGEPDPAGVRDAVDVLRDPARFYDFTRYTRAVDAVTGWMNCLGATGIPGQFRGGFTPSLPRVVTGGSAAALTDERLLATLSRPFQGYYDEVLVPRLVAGRYDVVGVNITYLWQLPFALWLIKQVRRALPDAFLVAGGTDVSDVWKYATRREVMFEVFADLDAVVIGEGETAYTTILEAAAAGTMPVHPNVRLHPRHGVTDGLPLLGAVSLRYEPVRGMPTPDYSGLPWDLYLSPERFYYYSPTRGCYWNKCTFCDYGLNTDGPTSPWRQDTVESMVHDVAALSAQSLFVYFSVDVLAPAAILRFAERVVSDGIKVRWGAEIRLEKYWSDERCELLRRSGCAAISVGFESGNQRILDLIDKGQTPAQVRRTMAAMTKAGIPVQVMGFTGFPTETAAEARESVDFLRDNQELWTFGGLGDFTLTPGAIVAKDPDRFGVSDVRPAPGADIARVLHFREPIAFAARAEVAAARAELPGNRYDRPWAGGVDAPHTFFYHDRYGTAVRSAMPDERTDDLRPDARYRVAGTLVGRPAEDTLAAYQRLYGRPAPGPGEVLFRRRDGGLVALPNWSRYVLTLFTPPCTLAAAGAKLPAPDVQRLWRFLVGKGALERELDGS
jgi:anaerobic magnesium-protoporphyrin IX monomethyl ester cyclase